MHIESYVVEVQNLTNNDWKQACCFKPAYKWGERARHGLFNLFGFLRRTMPAIENSTNILAITAKADALQKARKLQRERKPRSVRIVRVWQEGAFIRQSVVWVNGTWLE